MHPLPYREPFFTSPWPSLAIAAVILGGYALQSWLGDQATAALVLTPGDVAHGRWAETILSMFGHKDWVHAGSNAIGALIFATPLARLIGTDWPRVMGFFLFYLICGVGAGALYAGIDLLAVSVGGLPGFEAGSDQIPILGASGAISGLMGAAARLLERRDRLAPIRSGRVIAMTMAFIVANVVVGLARIAPGAEGKAIAWQCHIIGFLIGLVLIGPWAALFADPSRRRDRTLDPA